MSIYLYKESATQSYIFKYKGFVFSPKPGSLMLIERASDGFVNLQAVYDNKAFRQNTNGHIFDDFVDPELLLDESGNPYGSDAVDIRVALKDFFVDAPAGGGTGASDFLGTLLHDSQAPEPGTTGVYYFITEGVCTWLDGQPYVKEGDEVLVVFEGGVYQYIYLPGPGTDLIVYYDEDDESVTVAVADQLIVSETISPEGYEEITLTIQ